MGRLTSIINMEVKRMKELKEARNEHVLKITLCVVFLVMSALALCQYGIYMKYAEGISVIIVAVLIPSVFVIVMKMAELIEEYRDEILDVYGDAPTWEQYRRLLKEESHACIMLCILLIELPIAVVAYGWQTYEDILARNGGFAIGAGIFFVFYAVLFAPVLISAIIEHRQNIKGCIDRANFELSIDQNLAQMGLCRRMAYTSNRDFSSNMNLVSRYGAVVSRYDIVRVGDQVTRF